MHHVKQGTSNNIELEQPILNRRLLRRKIRRVCIRSQTLLVCCLSFPNQKSTLSWQEDMSLEFSTIEISSNVRPVTMRETNWIDGQMDGCAQENPMEVKYDQLYDNQVLVQDGVFSFLIVSFSLFVLVSQTILVFNTIAAFQQLS